MPKIEYEEIIPNLESFIKSIAEQGYSLETALVDLIDNSVSANADKIEMLTKNNRTMTRLSSITNLKHYKSNICKNNRD